MSKFKSRPGQGTLFINAEKKTEKAPDYKGELICDQDYGKGSVIKISGWKKPTPKNHLISLAVDNYKANTDKQWPKPVDTDEDEVPF